MNDPSSLSPILSSNPEVAATQRKLLRKKQDELQAEKIKLDKLEKNVKLLAEKLGVTLV